MLVLNKFEQILCLLANILCLRYLFNNLTLKIIKLLSRTNYRAATKNHLTNFSLTFNSMDYKLTINFCLLLFMTSIASSFRDHWGTLLFVLPNQVTDLGKMCANKRYTRIIQIFVDFNQICDLFRLPPPPRTLWTPQLQSTCHYIVNHYGKIFHVRLGVWIICTHQAGGGGGGGDKRKRSQICLSLLK